MRIQTEFILAWSDILCSLRICFYGVRIPDSFRTYHAVEISEKAGDIFDENADVFFTGNMGMPFQQ